MGLGETQVFQDEKSRLANTTVARIVAAKGSLNDPETKRPRAGPEIHRPSSQTRSDALGAAGAAARRRHAGRAAGAATRRRQGGAGGGPAAALFRHAAGLGGETRTRRPHLLPEQQRAAHDLDETGAGGAHSDGHRGRATAPGDVPGDLSARGRARLPPTRPRAEHGPGDDSDRTRWRRPRRPVRSTSAGRAAAARAVLPIHGSRPRRLNA